MQVQIVEHDHKEWDSVRNAQLDSWTVECLNDHLQTGRSGWVQLLFVPYGEGVTRRLIRLTDIMLGRPVDAPARWVRRVGHEIRAVLNASAA